MQYTCRNTVELGSIIIASDYRIGTLQVASNSHLLPSTRPQLRALVRVTELELEANYLKPVEPDTYVHQSYTPLA